MHFVSGHAGVGSLAAVVVVATASARIVEATGLVRGNFMAWERDSCERRRASSTVSSFGESYEVEMGWCSCL